jgi:hypothetical protein
VAFRRNSLLKIFHRALAALLKAESSISLQSLVPARGAASPVAIFSMRRA